MAINIHAINIHGNKHFWMIRTMTLEMTRVSTFLRTTVNEQIQNGRCN